jgi:transposase-like protein
MSRKCPNCRSLNVRRSSHGKDASAQPLFRSPYRCRECGEKFWVISRKIYRRVGAFVALNTVFFALVAGLVALFVE